MGRTIDRPEDENAVVETTVKVPKLNWKEPVFDPAHPREFAHFIAAHRKWIVHLFQQQFGQLPSDLYGE